MLYGITLQHDATFKMEDIQQNVLMTWFPISHGVWSAADGVRVTEQMISTKQQPDNISQISIQ